MQHRQLRLGDIVDDYCPRERRLTNHAVVAMVGSDIKQTRCTTCDTEHEYKHARVPAARKKKDAPPALFKQVLASAQPEALRAAQGTADEAQEREMDEQPAPEQPATNQEGAVPPAEARPAEETGNEQLAEEAEGQDEGPVHRRLIRATLPRPEGGPVQPRPLPQFTVRHPGKFGGPNNHGGRPGGGMSRPRTTGGGRGAFSRPGGRDAFSTRPSGNPHGAQRSRPAPHRGGRPMRHGKKSSK